MNKFIHFVFAPRSTWSERIRVVRIIVKNRIRSPRDWIRVTRTAYGIWRRAGWLGIKQTTWALAESEYDASANGYAAWCKKYDEPSDSDLAEMRLASARLPIRPLISIILPTYNTPPDLLREAVASVTSQAYSNWELCIADDCSTNPEVRDILNEISADDNRVKVEFRQENGHISAASNTALSLASGDWIALLDHDDVLAPAALFEVAKAINEHPSSKLIYSDEDKLDEQGRRCDHYFKPDWNYHLFLSQNLVTHLAVFRADVIEKTGGFRTGFEGAQDYDLTLRVVEHCRPGEIIHIPKILYHWRRVAGSTALSGQEKPYAMLAGERALNSHLKRQRLNGRAGLENSGYRVRYASPDPAPLVSIIVPTRDRVDLLQTCVDSITTQNTYPNWELIIVDNNSGEAATRRWLDQAQRDDARIRVLRDEGDFNYSRLNNRAARMAKGEYLLLLNNDIEAVHSDWLAELVSVCVQDGVGAVGARLWFPDDTLQHAGIILGLGGIAGHPHQGLARGLYGYKGRAALRQEFAATTGACLLTKKDLYQAVGGLDEVDLKVAFNDVDYCLKLGELGWKVVWTPYAELIHHESASRGHDRSPEKKSRFDHETKVMLERWGATLNADPAYNPNLSTSGLMFQLAFPPREN